LASTVPRRVRPVNAPGATVIVRLQQTQFSALRDSVKQGLTLGPATSAPLHLRTTLATAGGPGLTAATGSHGELVVGWLTDGGWGAEVWDVVQGKRLGEPLKAPGAPWTSVSLAVGTTISATTVGSSGTSGWLWTGDAWVPQPAVEGRPLVTAWGTFRTDTSPGRIYQAKATGWLDLGLPRDDGADLILLGSTEDGLAAFLASSRDAHRSFYLWKPGEGWRALPPPPASGPPWPELWAVTSGAGSLYHLEGRDKELLLRPFDGTDWHPALDLSALAPQGARAATLVAPSAWSKTGSLVLATDQVSVYDLP